MSVLKLRSVIYKAREPSAVLLDADPQIWLVVIQSEGGVPDVFQGRKSGLAFVEVLHKVGRSRSQCLEFLKLEI